MVPSVFCAALLCCRKLGLVPAANGFRSRLRGYGANFPDFTGFMALAGFRAGWHTGTALFFSAPHPCPEAGRTCKTNPAAEFPFKPGIPRKNMDAIFILLALDASKGRHTPFSDGKPFHARFILGRPCFTAFVGYSGVLLAAFPTGSFSLLCCRFPLRHHSARGNFGRKYDPGIFCQNWRSHSAGKFPVHPHALGPAGIKTYFYKIKDGERHRNPMPFPVLSTFTGVGFV